MAPGAAQAQAVQARAASYRIPAGPLAEALPRFADAAGVTVLFGAALLARAAALNGSYSVSEGFARLLAGSGLAARERSAGIYAVVPRGRRDEPGSRARRGRGSRPAPAWQSSTDRKRLDELQVRNWSDFGRRVEPGVNFNRLTNSINIRGLDQDRVLTRVDGIRLPWLDDGARGVKGGLESVDFNSLSRLDIVRGADASGSGGGSGAISGIADLRTLNPSDLLEDGKRFGALAKTDYDTTDSSWGANAALAGQIHENTFWLVQAGLRNGTRSTTAATWAATARAATSPRPRTTASAASCSLQQRVDGGHRFGVTGEYFKRTADFDNMFEQGAGTSYLYGENSVRKETERQRVSLDYSYRAPSDGGLLDTVTAALYWQRVSLDTRQTAVRSVDPRAFIIPRDPFRYELSQRPVWPRQQHPPDHVRRERRGDQAPGRRGDAVVDPGRRVVRQQNRAAIQRLRQLPRDPSRTPAPFGPRACMLHTNQADVPQSKGSQWAMWVQDEFRLRRRPLHADAGAARHDHARSPRAPTATPAIPMPASCLGQQRRPLLAQAAGWKAADELSLYAQYAYGSGAQPVPALHQLRRRRHHLRVGNPDLKPETSKGWELAPSWA